MEVLKSLPPVQISNFFEFSGEEMLMGVLKKLPLNFLPWTSSIFDIVLPYVQVKQHCDPKFLVMVLCTITINMLNILLQFWPNCDIAIVGGQLCHTCICN